ncbi:MAG: nodulation protein NfeD [Treponema sp.]|jgi:membrane-bound serine protease (ClpP class)|nr:nodulation protein NfeD [Treponema sp.]
MNHPGGRIPITARPVHALVLFCLLWAGSFLSAQDAEGQKASGGANERKAWIIPVQGDIEPSMTAFVRREGRKAVAGGAEFIIFEIDTFGGRVDSALQITSFITSIKSARTIAWVNSGAASMGVSWSAGALIALACQDIYMASGTSLGAAAPVTIGMDGSSEGAGEKTVAAVRSQMAALAERNGHPVGIALAMVDYDVELWEVLVNGQASILTLPELELLEKISAESSGPERQTLISPQGKLLSLTAGEAVRFGLARGLANDREALFTTAGISGQVVESSPGTADGLISFLTSAPVQALLIILGLVMIFLEIQSPGFGIFGVVAIVAFATVFGSEALLGKVGSAEIVLFILGVALLAVEIFLLPGFGVAGISGLTAIGVSLVLSMQDFTIPRFDWEWQFLGRNVVVVCIGMLAAVLGIVIIALLSPRLHLFDALTLKTRITATAGGSPEEASPPGRGDYADLVGKIGVAASILRPSGRVEIDGEIYSAEADGSFVEPGQGVKVTRVRGNIVTVRLV